MSRSLTVDEITRVHQQYPAVFKRPLKQRLVQWFIWTVFTAFTLSNKIRHHFIKAREIR